tara:strand:- start:422 stop:1633 length:1212 start_codon:yes stop_codon:yes gene_type:complete
MRILIYGINNSPELTGIGKYTGEMAHWLSNNGYDVKVVCAQPYYPEWKIHDGYKKYWYSLSEKNNLKVVRCPLYVPSNITRFKRIIHLASFAFSSFFALFSMVSWKPDVVIHVTPTLFCSLNTLIFAQISGGKSVLHIQDFEIDAMFGLVKVKDGRIKKLILKIEKKIYEKYDHISTISSGMMDRAITKGVKKEKLILFPNWCELDHLKAASYNVDLFAKFNINLNKKIILYSGNIGEKQGLEVVIDAAKKLQEINSLHFVFVGEGAAKNNLVNLSKKYALSNVSFFPLQPYEILPDLLASASAHLVIQKSGVADMMLPSKLTNILAVGGNAIITADRNTTLGNLCFDFPGIASLCKPESSNDLIESIKKTLLMESPNQIAINYANKNLDKDKILEEFVTNFL